MIIYLFHLYLNYLKIIYSLNYMIILRKTNYSTRVNMASEKYIWLELTARILKDTDGRNLSLAIFMDSSKAFDILDHQIMLTKIFFMG